MRRCTSEAMRSTTANTTASAKFCFTITAAPATPPARTPSPKARAPDRRTAARVSAIASITNGAAKISPSASWLTTAGVTANAAATRAAQRAPRSPTTWWAAQPADATKTTAKSVASSRTVGGHPVTTATR